MQRKTLTELQAHMDKTLCNVTVEHTAGMRGNYIILKAANGDILFCVDADDIFDADGMRFEDDLSPPAPQPAHRLTDED
jgi:hypothetical protein